MKVSIIFIVLVVFGLAALPLVLDPHQPLRYRVQSFLQFSTAGCFWLVAILVLAFSVSSVTFEQRDKIIWQTMTKPVAAWQYILGKWLGVSALAGALMLVCASGIFLFTEHLRNQPAMNETSSYVAQSGAGITEDRFILETQVLTARATVRPDPLELDEEQFQKNVEERVKAEMNNLAQTISDPEALRNKREELTRSIAYSLRKAVQADFRSIPPGRGRAYTFSGLEAARESNRPLVLRFKLEAGANRPDENYRVTIEFAGGGAQIEQIGLGQFHSIPVSPSYVDAKGVLTMQIINGDAVQRVANAEYLSFSNEGLEVSYATGGFRANFFRCIGILWIKLVFLAMLAIAASTFLSFPVACLVSFSIFLAAEGAGFIAGALENYSTEDRNGKMLLIPTLIAKIAGVVSGAFRVYADLRPTGRIVDGLALSWMDVAGGVVVLGGASAVLYVGAVYIFRRRELATYSGN